MSLAILVQGPLRRTTFYTLCKDGDHLFFGPIIRAEQLSETAHNQWVMDVGLGVWIHGSIERLYTDVGLSGSKLNSGTARAASYATKPET